MNRKQLVISRGATCKNWSWSWSFINRQKRLIIFGAWEHLMSDGRCLILHRDWEYGQSGKRSSAFRQSIQHIKLVERGEYRLTTFPMVAVDSHPPPGERIKIHHVIPRLTPRGLVHEGGGWYGIPYTPQHGFPEETAPQATFVEGATMSVTVNAHERNREARAVCIAHYGAKCVICGFEAALVYSEIADGLIHVHHLVPLSQKSGDYRLDPVRDLRPVCPNCHAVIHYATPPLSIDEVRGLLNGRSD